MRCTVLLFAQIAEAIGARRLSLDLPEGASVDDAVKTLQSRHSALESWRGKLTVAVNERYAPADLKLREADTIALIPPVSGG